MKRYFAAPSLAIVMLLVTPARAQDASSSSTSTSSTSSSSGFSGGCSGDLLGLPADVSPTLEQCQAYFDNLNNSNASSSSASSTTSTSASSGGVGASSSSGGVDVPEPAILGIFALAAGGLLVAKRRAKLRKAG